VRKLISKFRKISQENRMNSQNTSNVMPLTTANSSQQVPANATFFPMNLEANESLCIANPAASAESQSGLLLPPAMKTRDKLETISERIETQQSQISQITSVHQSPPLQRAPKSSKWKWLKTGSTGPETESPPRASIATGVKPSSPPLKPSTNPFDSNLTDVDLLGIDSADGNDKQVSIAMSLFIPKSAQNETITSIDIDNQDNVSSIHVSCRKHVLDVSFPFVLETTRRVTFRYQHNIRCSS
jgi:hypothetical protein